MKTTTLKITSLILLAMATLFTITYTGCKKEDLNNTTNNQLTAKQIQQNAIAAIKAKYGNVSGGEVINVNKVANSLTYSNQGNTTTIPTTPPNDDVCYNCNNTNNPNNIKQTYTLASITRLYECESNGGSSLLVTWTVNAPYLPTNINSSATVTFTPNGGSPTTTTTNNISVQLIGNDPDCDENKIYQVTYTTQYYANSYFDNGGVITTSMSLYNNCALLGNVVNTGTISTTIVGKNFKAPCNRIDKVFVNPNTGPSNCATAIGCYTLCTPPAGLVLIDKHQIEYRKIVNPNGNLLWDNQVNSGGSPSPIYWGKLAGSSSLSPTITPNGIQILNLEQMLPGSGNWLVRYRNVLTNTCDVIFNNGVPPNTPPGPFQAGANWGQNSYWTAELWSL